MATVLTDAQIIWAGIELTGQSNSIAFELGRQMLDDTTYGSGRKARTRKAGLATTGVAVEGFWDAAMEELLLDEHLGDSARPLIVSPSELSFAKVAYMTEVVAAEYTPSGTGPVGDLRRFSWSAESGGRPLRGQILYYGSTEESDTGESLQLGATADGQHVYAAIIVLDGDAETIVAIESDSSSDFDGDPTTRFTTTVDSGVARAAEWHELEGPITDQYWRVDVTVDGTSDPERRIVVAIAIA